MAMLETAAASSSTGRSIAGEACFSTSYAVTHVRPWRFPNSRAASASRKNAARSPAVPGTADTPAVNDHGPPGTPMEPRTRPAEPSRAVARTRRTDR